MKNKLLKAKGDLPLLVFGMIYLGILLPGLTAALIYIFLTDDAWGAIAVLLLLLYGIVMLTAVHIIVMSVIVMSYGRNPDGFCGVCNLIGLVFSALTVTSVILVFLGTFVDGNPVVDAITNVLGAIIYSHVILTLAGGAAQLIVHIVRRGRKSENLPKSEVLQ